MKKIITPGVTQRYVNTCGHCMCTYEYEDIDVCDGWGLGSVLYPYVICPYCGTRNNIYSKIPYRPEWKRNNDTERYKITFRSENQNEQWKD